MRMMIHNHFLDSRGQETPLPDLDRAQSPRNETAFAFPADGLDLAATAAPVAWGQGRWPTVDWIDAALVQVRRHPGGDQLSLIRVEQQRDSRLVVRGFEQQDEAEAWLRRTMGWGRTPPSIDDAVIAGILRSAPGLRPFAHGSLAQALLTVIIGQGVTVQAGAVMERRVAELHSTGIEYQGRRLIPFPDPGDLAHTPVEWLRATGLTWRRAEGMTQVARTAAEGGLPSEEEARADPDETIRRLRALPMIGPWSAAAALLWGLAIDDAHVTGDAALLRAAKQEYNRPDLTLRSLDALAESWRPGRGWAARALWLRLLGPAPVPPNRTP
jgi:3-methyladenine DNA glycosylase/8-oxoguanine DNA glycosylase